MIKQTLKPKNNSGFTLIEMALVVTIGGILLSFLGSALLTFVEKNRIRTTEFRITTINDALATYLRVYGNYPCPSNRELGPGDAEFARTVAADCRTGAIPGTDDVGGIDGVRIGSVPTRNLNLADEFGQDGWGRKFTYAVSKQLATSQEYEPDAGRISILDVNSNTVVFPASTAHYIIVSHGRTGDGGYPFSGSTVPVTPCSTSLDGENCDGDDTFRITLVNSEADIAAFYDDYAEFIGQTDVALEAMPAGAIVPFNLEGLCPSGWKPFTPAEGRFMAGALPTAPYDQLMQQYAFVLASPPANANIKFSPEEGELNNGDAQAIVPPFVSLQYCERCAASGC